MRKLEWTGLAVSGLLLVTACQQGENDNSVEAQGPDKSPTLEQKISQETARELPRLNGQPASIPSPEVLKEFLEKEAAPMPVLPGPASPDAGPDASLAKEAAYSCNMTFNTKASLGYIPNKAGDTFATWPYYIESCYNNTAAYAVPMEMGHYHLNYENDWLCTDPFFPKDRVGTWASLPTRTPPGCSWNLSKCTLSGLDPSNYGRYIQPHVPYQRVQVYVNRSGSRRTFTLKSINIRGLPNDGCNQPNDGKIQLWIRKAATGQWFYWSELLPGYIWSPYPADGQGLDEMRITSPYDNSWSVDDIKLDVTN